MRTENEIRTFIKSYISEYLTAMKENDKHRKRDIERSLAALYWVLEEAYVLPSPVDKTMIYDKVRCLSPKQMAKFFDLDENYFCQEITTNEWVKILKQKGLRY